MRYSWIFEVLRDLQTFCRENGFRDVERKLSDVIDVAEAEVPAKVLRDLDHLAKQEGWSDERDALRRVLRSFEAGPQATLSRDNISWRDERAMFGGAGTSRGASTDRVSGDGTSST